MVEPQPAAQPRSPTGGTGRRITGVKVRKLVGCATGRAVGEAEAAGQQSEAGDPPAPHGRQGRSHPQGGRAPARLAGTGEGKRHHPSAPPSFCPPLPMPSVAPHGTAQPSGQGGRLSRPCPPQPLVPPGLLAVGWGEGQRCPWLPELCWAGTKPSLCYQHCFHHKSKTAPY